MGIFLLIIALNSYALRGRPIRRLLGISLLAFTDFPRFYIYVSINSGSHSTSTRVKAVEVKDCSFHSLFRFLFDICFCKLQCFFQSSVSIWTKRNHRVFIKWEISIQESLNMFTEIIEFAEIKTVFVIRDLFVRDLFDRA